MLPTQLQIGNTNGKKQKSNAIIRSPLNGTGNIADRKISPIFQENKRGLRHLRGRLFFGHSVGMSILTGNLRSVEGENIQTFDFCFRGPFSVRMVVLAPIPTESQHMRLMAQKQSSERPKEPHSDRILSVALLLQNSNSGGIISLFGGYEVFCVCF